MRTVSSLKKQKKAQSHNKYKVNGHSWDTSAPQKTNYLNFYKQTFKNFINYKKLKS